MLSTVRLAVANTLSAVRCSQALAPTVARSYSNSAPFGSLADEEVLQKLTTGELQHHNLERDLGNALRAVKLRRKHVASMLESNQKMSRELDHEGFDYEQVIGVNCENVIGYMPIPVGVAGPLVLDGRQYMVPMATTEGCLVASTNRGCRAIALSGGAHSAVLRDGMTRAPVVRMPDVIGAAALKDWVEADMSGERKLASLFESTSRFAKLKGIKVNVAGRNVFLRFEGATGDAMGMNMISKGVTKALDFLQDTFPKMDVVSISGNFCTDKKPSAVNWIDGRGKSVVCETIIQEDIVNKVLKTTSASLVDVNNVKNLVGSMVAGSIGEQVPCAISLSFFLKT
uniref:hydroxymethylglutaryl-CoA reductase (NADPH) n=1 Tax=Palpitomonas bilix TaxID=652834 RepID=A0A7S3CZ30_9EUKA|mmetsp:Transcript_1520/g.3038  ORF Transcript_1520/g.3038 Transcript_1520/m.3038 type:complete len:342 (+) Transcript_1520:85-1110(+)